MMDTKEMIPDRSITLLIESRLENVSLVGITVQAVCDFIFVNRSEPHNMELSVTEAVTNSIKHAYKSEPGHTVEIKISFFNDKVVFQISDTGKSMESRRCQPGNICLNFEPDEIETLPVGGMGLHIMNSLMDEVSYKTIENKNTLTLIKLLKK